MALFLILLMSLMAFSVAFTTATELKVSSNADSGRRAFIQADSALQLSVLISRIMLFPSSGSLSAFLPDDDEDIIIEVNEDDFDLALLRWDYSENDYRKRYLKAGAKTSGIPLGPGAGRGAPLMTFRKKNASGGQGPVLATSALSLDYAESAYVGSSLSQTTYREQNTGRRTVIIVTTDGRAPANGDDESALLDGSSDAAHAVLTTAFQELR
ncbi:MAG: hypothetical protein LBJ64_11895 [Deltaproteobacteria bacterium]|jgi:hypothetical protein|nr:hypothetical protein [Deltaproteobacteria bacterium]